MYFKPHPKQEQFIEAVFSGKYSFLSYGGSMGGGKSYVSIATLILLSKIYPNSKWCVIRESLPTLKRTTLPTFKKVLPTNFLADYNQTDNIATFTNGSQIMFMSEDYTSDKDFDRFKGLEVNGFLLEQIEELNKDLLDVCIIRAGRHKLPKMPKPIIMATLNPSQNWVKKSIYERYINGTLPDDWFYLPATIFDNPDLSNDKNYMSRLSNLDDITYRRHIEGDWSAFSVNNPFAYAFDESKHIQDYDYDPSHELQLSFDFNIDPITCIAAQWIDSRIRVIKEFRLANSNIYELCERIKVEYPFALFIVTGDATGHNRTALTSGTVNYYTVIQSELKLSDGQMRQPNINPSINDSRVLLNSILQNFPPAIHSECKYLIEDLKYVEVNENGDIDKNKDKHRSHLLDCQRYLLNSFYAYLLNTTYAD